MPMRFSRLWKTPEQAATSEGFASPAAYVVRGQKKPRSHSCLAVACLYGVR